MSARTGTLTLTMPTEREIVMTRVFEAPRRLVFDAFTKPELLRRWLLGPDGWSMPVCDIDLKVGGSYRYVWRHDTDGVEMSAAGVYREIVLGERVVATERFEPPWYPGEALVSMALVEAGGRTTLTQTLRYESREVRDVVLRSPMASGVEASLDRLEGFLGAPAR